MNQSILHRIAINKTGQPLKRLTQARRDSSNKLDAETMSKALNEQLDNTDKHGLHTIPRKTMLEIVKLDIDIPYSFRVAKGDGENYVNAMRQVLSRTRKKALRKKMRLDDFKLLQIGPVKHELEYDEVTLIRSKTLSPHEESVYDELFNALKKE